MRTAKEINCTLRDHRATFEALGVRQLRLFSSQARGDAGPDPDIDIGVEMNSEQCPAGLAYFGRLQDVEDLIVAVLDKTVDVSDEESLRSRVKVNFVNDWIVALLRHADKSTGLLHDIVENIERIEKYTSDMTLTAFQKNAMVIDAVERCCQRIAEASTQLEADADDLLPTHKSSAIRRLTEPLHPYNSYVHAERIWKYIELDLPLLKHDCKKCLAKDPSSDD